MAVQPHDARAGAGIYQRGLRDKLDVYRRENINEVERLACEQVGCKYAVSLSAGTAALHMAVKLAGVKPGEKVIAV